MSLKIGIVGLPNVGKSTLFNALTRSQGAEAQNYPFCTIDPNVGIVEVPDERLRKLEELVKPEKTIPAAEKSFSLLAKILCRVESHPRPWFPVILQFEQQQDVASDGSETLSNAHFLRKFTWSCITGSYRAKS